MSKIKTALKLLSDPKRFQKSLADNITAGKLFRILPDKAYLKLVYRLYMGKKLNLKTPKTYNEKLQWLKIYDRKDLYTTLVDKAAVKDYVAKTIGEEYIIPTYGTWNSPEEIDFDSLPNQFVLKWNHDSGSIVICKDKSTLDRNAALTKLERGKKANGFWYGREWPYKNVKPYVLAEKYMEDSATGELRDYKFYCFGGKPKFLYLSRGLGGDHSKAELNYFDLNWEKTPFQREDFRSLSVIPEKPKNFDLMVEIAAKLSSVAPFLRVDLYEVNGAVYFSELTFFPGSGYTPLNPPEWDETVGTWITLPQEKTRDEI